jgi:phospholipid/cholesterol/gamma-HCH transport system substrate-binding protein
MESRREEALVGVFVLVAAAILIVTVFLLTGTFSSGGVSYKAFFKNAGGLSAGSEVHYAGGPAVGRVKKVASDPNDSTRMEIDFYVKPDVPVKTDSIAEITSNSPLGDNFLGIDEGSRNAPKAPAGSTLNSKPYSSLADIADVIQQIAPNANMLIDNLNDRVVELKVTLDRVNDLLSPQNEKHISGSLADLHGMLDENRANIRSSLNNVNAASAKLSPLIDNLHHTAEQADQALAHIDATISEDRPDLKLAITNLRQTLGTTVTLTGNLDSTVDANSESLDEIIDNLRHVTENLNEFTETIKTRPYTLIRSSGIKPRQPGDALPK